jgi:DNA-binding MarR family transcriptional regulator
MAERDDVIDRILHGQRLLQRSLSFAASNPLMATNVTMPQLKALLVIFHCGASGGQDLTRVLGVSLATVTGIVDRLVAHGWVNRGEDPNDRRIRRLELTAAGRELVDGIVTAGAEHHRRILAHVNLRGLRVIEEANRLMREAVAKEATLTDEISAAAHAG